MANIFNSPQQIKGAFRANLLAVNFGPIQSGMLVQNIQFSFSQAVSLLYELGVAGVASNVYMVAGRAQGNASIARVLGPVDIGLAFITQFGDPCNAVNNTVGFQASAGCSGNTSSVYTLSGCVINQIGVSVTAQDVIINEQISMQYVNLDRS